MKVRESEKILGKKVTQPETFHRKKFNAKSNLKLNYKKTYKIMHFD